MNRIKPKEMDDLPELPFEQVLSYLSLEDRLKARAVSRTWRNKINSFKVKSLCYSQHPIGRIHGKCRWVSGAFAQNFIRSTRFKRFFDAFNQTILSSLKRLRLCGIDLNKEKPMAIARILNSFVQLEQLDIIQANCDQQREFNLNLPMLTGLQIEEVNANFKFTLKAPKLLEVKILDCYGLRMEIVHGESAVVVERLLVDRWEYTEVKELKNLQYLYVPHLSGADPTFLSSLQQLKEFHLFSNKSVSEVFDQMRRSDRVELKIYLCGLLLNGPDDPAINAFRDSSREWLVTLAENRSRLAEEIPFYQDLHYSIIERVASGLEVELLKRFTHLTAVTIARPIQDIERFLDLLKNRVNIVQLTFGDDHPQDLFDRLPEYCAIQKLALHRPPSDQTFLFRLKHLIRLDISWTIDGQTVRRAFDELPVLSSLSFFPGAARCSFARVTIENCHPKQFSVSRGSIINIKKTFYSLNAAIEFIFGKEKPSSPKKRKAEDLK